MTASRVKPALTLAGFLAVLTYLMMQGKTSSPQQNEAFYSALTQVEISHAELLRDLLAARVGLFPHYDKLNTDISRFYSAAAHLQALCVAPMLSGPAIKLENSLDRKERLLEAFKADNALLHNSMNYFVRAQQTLSKLAIKQDNLGLATTINQLASAMLRFARQPNQEPRLALVLLLNRLNACATQPPLTEAVRLLQAHSRLIADYLPRVDYQLQQLLAAPVSEHVQSLRDSYEISRERIEERATVFRILLYATSVVLLLYLIHQYIRLYRTHNQLMLETMERQKAETDGENLQKQLYQSQKMEAVGTLAGGIAHDFNNVLGLIFGYCEMALNAVHEPARASNYIGKVHAAARHGKALVDRILMFSRISPGDRTLIKSATFFEETMEWVKASVPDNIKLHQQLHAGDEFISVDSTQIQQVLINLCNNAIQSMAGNGILKMTLDVVNRPPASLSNSCAKKFVCFGIADTGCGMDQIVLNRIFDPFFTTKKAGEGTGLGLAIVDRIIKEHGGAVTVESEPGKGTTFEIYVPCGEPKDNIAAPEQTASSKSGGALANGEIVMLVEDDPALLKMGEEMLAELGYEPVGFNHPEEALIAFRANPGHFDLVITDQSMPGLKGTDLAKLVREVRQDIPILLVTGYGRSISQQVLDRSGARKVLGKPLSSQDLSKAIASCLAASSKN